MSEVQRFALRLRNFFAPARAERELSREVAAHLSLLEDDLEHRGAAPKDAPRLARRAFGGIEQAKECQRDERSFPWLEDAKRDVSFAIRRLRRSPGFTAVALLTVALGVGINSALFTLVNAVLLRPLPVMAPEDLVLFTTGPGESKTDPYFPYPLYEQLRDSTTTLAGLAVGGNMTTAQLRSDASGDSEPIRAERVSGNYFDVLGVKPAAGRLLTNADDQSGHATVVVLSDGFWARRFNRDPAAIGRSLVLGETPFTIVGVAPPGFSGFVVGERPELWYPLRTIEQIPPPNLILRAEDAWWLQIVGRLKPGVSRAQAAVDANVTFARDLTTRGGRVKADLGERWTPDDRKSFFENRIFLKDGSTGATPLRQEFGAQLTVLSVVAAVVLLIVCGNVANLLLARANARTREIAARIALGASRPRIVRQLLTEGLVLAVAGGALGMLFARWGAGLLVASLPRSGTAFDLSPDIRIVAFTVVASMATGLTFAILPALRASSASSVSGSGRPIVVGSGHSRSWPAGLSTNSSLVVVQVALTFFLLAGTALLVRTLVSLKSLDAGFNPTNLTSVTVDVGAGRESAEQRPVFTRLLAELRTLPGVQSASYSRNGLMTNNTWALPVTVPGYTPQPNESMRTLGQESGPAYLAAVGTPLRAGRDFVGADIAAGARIAIINETMARRFFGGGSPIGRQFVPQEPGGSHHHQAPAPFQIVGVAADVKHRSLRETVSPAFIVPFGQGSGSHLVTFQVRTTTPRPDLSVAIRRVVREIDPKTRVTSIDTMEDLVDNSLRQEHFVARLGTSFSGLALLLAAVGLYGVMSYAVVQRAKDLAIRASLGATRGSLSAMVARQNLTLVLIGLAAGIPFALMGGRLVRTLLFAVEATDPIGLAAAAGALLTAGILAGYLPARRAGRVNPITLLRLD